MDFTQNIKIRVNTNESPLSYSPSLLLLCLSKSTFQGHAKQWNSLVFWRIIQSLEMQQFLILNQGEYKQKWQLNNQQQQIITQGKHSVMMYNFNFQTQANLDDSDYSFAHDPKSFNLPTTTHNSPGSLKSESISLQLNDSYQNSFQAGTQANHANDIWSASLNFLNNTLYGKIDENGFNSNTFFHSRMSGPIGSDKTLDEAIKQNKLLRSRQKSKFMETLKNQTEICGLLVELMVLFNATLFNELTYVIHNIWQRNYLRYRQKKNQASKLLPQFSCFFGFQGQEENIEQVSMFEEADLKEIKRAALDGIEELGHQLFYSKKLKYLNLQGVLQSKVEKQELKGQFIVLLKAISKSVFLSAEGLYEDEVRIPIFSEQDQEECEPFELEEANRFVRTFSQIQQDDEFDYSLSSTNKRRKLQ